MSKILDTLNHESRKKFDSIQEQLAEIYISPTKKKKIVKPSEIRRTKTLSVGWKVMLVLLLILTLSSIFLLISRNRVNINITIIDEEEVAKIASKAEDFSTEELESVQGSLSSLPPNLTGFNGSAVTSSRLSDRYLYLVNSRGPVWANVKVRFDEPVNVTGNILSFTAKGERGGEALSLVLKDALNNTYHSPNIMPVGFGKDWQNVSINLNRASQLVDLTQINEIWLEFGSATINNSIGATIYIKDIILINKER